jgi:SAM-dependent methyltransferase
VKKIVCIDHLVTGEEFALLPHDNYAAYVTTPAPADTSKYYDHPEYVSHKKKGFSLFFLLYSLLRKFNNAYKLNLIKHCVRGKGILLDFGAGTGSFALEANKKGWEAFGFEPNQAAHSSTIDYVDEWNVSSQYDVITAWHVLEHLHDPSLFLEQAHEALTSLGTVVVALPNFCSWDAQKYGDMWAGYDVPRHLWHFSPDGFSDLANDCGFVVEAKHPLKLDAYYVSLLSEKNKKSKWPWLLAFYAGWRSNHAAKQTKNHSSVIYILKKQK